MSGAEEEIVIDNVTCCASCGKAEVDDDIKLKKCTCMLVKYCSADCQKNHRPQHREACKKRLAELREEILFTQPESNHFGDCPICCVPLSIDETQSPLTACCCKHICFGCFVLSCQADGEDFRPVDRQICPYCRQRLPGTQEEMKAYLMKRAEVNDPIAFQQLGTCCFYAGDFRGALENWKKGAAMGDVGSHFELSCLYRDGQGVEKNRKKQIFHLEEAAIGGDPVARHNLGCVYSRDFFTWGTAVKHLKIAANLGYDGSLRSLREMYTKKVVSKEEYAAALRGHQAAVNATKSPHRVQAEEFMRRQGYSYNPLTRRWE